MTNKLVVIINSLKVPKIKKPLLYEMKFLVPNYSCLQNPWLEGRGLPPPDPLSLSSVLNWICWPTRTKCLCTPLDVWRKFECYMKLASYFNEAGRLQSVQMARNCRFSFAEIWREKKERMFENLGKSWFGNSLMSNTSCTSSYSDVPRHTSL